MTSITKKVPTLDELVKYDEQKEKQDKLTYLLNQQPHSQWLKPHPTVKAKDAQGNTVPAQYLPIDKIEFLLTKIYRKWWVEIKDTKVIANSCCVTVRLYVENPLTGQTEWQEGVGAKSIQTKSGAGAMDWQQVQDAGVMMALPSAESYAIKDAAEKLGRIFGRDLNRKETVSYDSVLRVQITHSDIVEMYESKKDLAMDEAFRTNVERVINNMETDKYKSIYKQLEAIN